jgi:hypothetical protein
MTANLMKIQSNLVEFCALNTKSTLVSASEI